MRRYADPERCPDCLSAITYGAPRCPTCGLSLEGSLASELFSTLSHADDLLADLRSASTSDLAVPVPAAAHAAGPPPGGVAVLSRPPAAPAGSPAPRPPVRQHHPTLSGASVPRILLALGALCLLVAALVFLAVTWSALGVGGRTATLVGFTAVAGLLAAWAARRELRAAAESLTVVALGLASFDLVGARDAGWLGEIDTPDFLVVLGAVVAVAGSAAALGARRRSPLPNLVSAEVVAALGIASVVAGATTGDRLDVSVGLVLGVVLAGAAALAARALGLQVVAVGGALVALFVWVLLAISSWDRAVQHASLRELWLEQEAWPLIAAAVLVALPAFASRLPDAARLTALGTSAVVLSGAVLAPFLDETPTTLAAGGAALLALVAALALVVPLPWRRSLAGPGALGAIAASVAALALAGEATARAIESGAALWTGSATDSLPARVVDDVQVAGWLLPALALSVGLGLVAAARSFTWADRAVAPLADPDALVGAVAATTALALALYAVPVWLVLGVLLAAGGYLLARAVHEQRALPLGLAAAFLAVALQLALHAPGLTLAALAVVLAGSLALHLRTGRLDIAVGAGAITAAAAAGLAWTVGALADVPEEWTAVAAILTLALLTLGGPYVDERLRVTGPATYARLGTEIGALASAAVVSLAALDPVDPSPTWSAAFLTLTGAAAAAMALLRPDRRPAGWLGGLLLAAASWVRLADLGVDTPEAYTLPSALALLVVGLVHLRRHADAATMPALGAGLALALVPSLLWSLADPVSVRSLVLGAATLALVLVGVRLRWSAPLVHGAVIGAVLVVRLATPVAEAVPRWALIGLAGAVLVALGITWEKRLRDARAVAGYVRGLR